jgi:hypothetical protein
MPARHLPARATGSLPSSARGIAWGLAAALVVAAVGCAHAVDEQFADRFGDASAPIGPVTNGLDASASVVAANGADIGSRVPGLTFDAGADEAIDAGVVSASDDASSAVADDADAPTATVATTAPTPSAPPSAPPATDASRPDDASTADEPPTAAPPPTSPPVTPAPPAPTCDPTACTNLCLPYFVSCCKADATCGCALLFPRGPCD